MEYNISYLISLLLLQESWLRRYETTYMFIEALAHGHMTSYILKCSSRHTSAVNAPKKSNVLCKITLE